MKIIYIEGDLVKSPEYVIAHGCNAQGVMRSGVAKAIREAYPRAYDIYHRVYVAQHHSLELGQVIPVACGDKTVLNIISQEFYGRDSNVVYVSYEAIKRAINRINALQYDRVGFPMIGAGLANGDWKIIEAIIEENSNFQPVVYFLPQ